VTASVTSDDVLAVLPAFVRQSDSAPVRDALAAALAPYRALSAYSAQQCDITRATGIYLESLCNEHGVYKQDGESDDSLRARALTVPTLVTPAAILAAASAILGAYTPIQAQYAESILDRWYVTDGTLAWHRSSARRRSTSRASTPPTRRRTAASFGPTPSSAAPGRSPIRSGASSSFGSRSSPA
jgi:hypothetical protein